MLVLCSILALSGCESRAREGAPPSTPAPAVVLGAEAQQVYQRTLVRDAAPSCAELVHGLDAPAEALLEVAERVTAPPSSSIRAATCLVREHAAAVEPSLERWVRERRTMGLGLVVLNDLDRLEASLAERLARAALDGEYASTARPRIARVRAELLGSIEGTTPGGSVSP